LIVKPTWDDGINPDILYAIFFRYDKELGLGSDVEILSHPSSLKEAKAYVQVSITREGGMCLLNHLFLC